MTGNTGYTGLTNASPMAGPAQINAVYAHFDSKFTTQAGNPGTLPTSGNWPGRIMYVALNKSYYGWNGAGWDLIGGQTPAFSVTSAATQTLNAGGETTLSGIWGSPSINRGFTSFAGGVLTVAASGWYHVKFTAYLTLAMDSSAILSLGGAKYYDDSRVGSGSGSLSIGNSQIGYVAAGGTISSAVFVSTAGNSLQNSRTSLNVRFVGI